MSISYPGASAQVVADTVAAPIEQQVNGVEGMLYMSSQMGNDGSYTLTVTFDIGTDLNTALVMVQNRVTLAMPQLPTQVQNQGITIRKKTPDILMIVNFFSPDGRYDDIYLSNYATINVRDELLRVEGVSDITYLGERDYSIRAWLDPQKLASLQHDRRRRGRRHPQSEPRRAGRPGRPAAGRRRASRSSCRSTRWAGSTTRSSSATSSSRSISARRPAPLPAPPSPSPQPTAASPGCANPLPSGGPSADAASSRRARGQHRQHRQHRHRHVDQPARSTSPHRRHRPTAATTSGGDRPAAAPRPAAARPRRRRQQRPAAAATGGGGTAGDDVAQRRPVDDQRQSTNSRRPASGVSGASTAAGRGPGRRPPASSACATWPASSWAPRTTTRPAPSTATRRSAWPSTNCPAPTPWTSPTACKQKMEELKTRFPDGVDYDIAYDTTPFIRESVEDVVQTLLEAVVLVGLVVLVFLQNWRAVLIPLVAVPVAIVGTFAVMAAAGLQPEQHLAVRPGAGHRHRGRRRHRRGRERRALAGARAAAARGATQGDGRSDRPGHRRGLVLCAVFVPCAFISGITGQFFRQFAVTIAVSTVISAFNSLTLSPALAAILLRAAQRRAAIR